MADTPSGYKRFDVVDVRDDSVQWGGLEGYPIFLRVYLPGITVDQARFLQEIQYDPTGHIDPDTGNPDRMLYKRAWRIVESRITPPIMAQIEAAWMVSGEYVVPDADGMLAWLEKKIDGSGRPEW
ncbi:MAG: hypothetical protein AMJ65_15555 [Phycisphaerae bacterium SG8_4]|nr:MAG: hypothetical protein AMJ65_15555 [Phycisphaerae bacterium SG8_4]